SRLGFEEARSLAEKNNEIPPLTIRIQEGMKRDEALTLLREKGIAARPTPVSPSGIVLEDIQSFQEIGQSLPYPHIAQDEAAQLVSFLLSPEPGERVLDACAAPGGKTAHIAGLMEDRGEIIAMEPEEKRIRLLEENMQRLDLRSVQIVRGDALMPRLQGGFDRILLDAPCSSLGVIRRNPDLRYRHSPKDLLKFKKRQVEMLRAMAPLLKQGGLMVYAVCSTEPEEGEQVIRTFLQDNPDFIIIEAEQAFLGPFAVRSDGLTWYRTYPHRDDMDGFFAARLKKVAKGERA
ncbi:MAG: RsmB/NOP family class I SAM-dependent RNA methyltransferase, partial [Nitrospirales bacterium]|nr:RsmB/NOP family class I SAM-dependent RNA methyltransferase [Nitrospirales bacterium]